MKKLLMGAMMSVFCLGSVSFAQFETKPELTPEMEAELQMFLENIPPIDTGCDLSINQLASIETASDLIMEVGHEKITKKHFSTSDFHTLIDTYNDDMVMKLEAILDLCRDGEYQHMYVPTSMPETMDMFVDYVQTVLTLKQFESAATNSATDPVRAGVTAIRKHVISDTYIDMLVSNPYIQQEFNMGMILDGKLEDGIVQGDLQFESDQQGRMDGSVSKSDVSLSGFLKFMDTYESIDVGGELDLDIRMVDGTMYIGLQKLDLMVGESNDPEIQQMLAMANLFEGKYIEIPFGDAVTGLDMQALMGSSMDMIQGLMTTDMMMTYDMQDGIYMAGMNPMVCNSLSSMFGGVSDCLEMVMDQVSSGDLLPMTYTNGVWSVLGEDMMPMVSRDAETLLSIEIPVETGVAQYKDGIITVIFTEDGTIVDVEGTYIDKKLAIQGSVTDDEMVATFDVSGRLGLDEYSLDIKLDIVPGEGEDCQDCYVDMEFGISGGMTEIDAIDVQAPAAEDIVDMGMFM